MTNHTCPRCTLTIAILPPFTPADLAGCPLCAEKDESNRLRAEIARMAGVEDIGRLVVSLVRQAPGNDWYDYRWVAYQLDCRMQLGESAEKAAVELVHLSVWRLISERQHEARMRALEATA